MWVFGFQIGSVTANLFITGVLIFLRVRADAVAQKASEHVTVSAKGTSFALENGVIGAVVLRGWGTVRVNHQGPAAWDRGAGTGFVQDFAGRRDR
jgi:hypothetical protein